MKAIKLFIAVLIITAIQACNNNNVGKPVLESIIGDWSNKINTIIQNAQNAGMVLEVTAAAQAQDLVEQVRIKYEGELDKTLDAFSTSEQKTFEDVTKAISGLDKGVTDALTNMGNVIAMLPGMNKTPQIRQCSGNIIAPNKDNYLLLLQGGFWDLAKENYKAVLKIKNSVYTAVVKDNNNIEFQLPKTLFPFSKDSIKYLPCEITIDYQKNSFLFFHKKAIAVFSQKLIILPEKFGSVCLQTTTLKDSTFIEPGKKCGPLVWSSKDGNTHQEILGCDMEPGWNCDINSVSEIAAAEEGRYNVDWFDLGNHSAPMRVQWQIMTTPKTHVGGNDGVRGIFLSYTRYQVRKVDVIKKDSPIDLNWGSKIILDIPRSSIWKLIITKYDGSVLEIASANQNSSLIKIDNIKDRQIALQVVPFNNL
jgi:hypothetical protein